PPGQRSVRHRWRAGDTRWRRCRSRDSAADRTAPGPAISPPGPLNGDTMSADDAWPLTCPVCDRDLARRARALTCASGHSFDVAREGYVNLLTPRDSERGITGDTA